MNNICYIILPAGAEIVSYYELQPGKTLGSDQLILKQPRRINLVQVPQQSRIGVQLLAWPPVLAVLNVPPAEITITLDFKDILVFMDDPPDKLVKAYIEEMTNIRIAQTMPKGGTA